MKNGEDPIKLVEPGEYAPESLQPPEQTLDLVTPLGQLPSIVPWTDAIDLRRHDRLQPHVHHELTGLIAFVGFIHHQATRLIGQRRTGRQGTSLWPVARFSPGE